MRPTTSRSVWAFFAGILTVNSVGHLATAAAGKEHLTPLAGRHSGPAVNALWGAMSLAGGLAIARRARTPGPRWGAEVHAFGAGAVTFAAWNVLSELVVPINTDTPSNSS